MSKYFIEDTTLTDIADAIRLKRDIVTEINPENMPLEISLIDGGGGGLEKLIDYTHPNATNINAPVNITLPKVCHIVFVFCYLNNPSTTPNILLKFTSSSNKNATLTPTVMANNDGTNLSAIFCAFANDDFGAIFARRVHTTAASFSTYPADIQDIASVSATIHTSEAGSRWIVYGV